MAYHKRHESAMATQPRGNTSQSPPIRNEIHTSPAIASKSPLPIKAAKLEPRSTIGVYLVELAFQFITTVRGGEVVGAESVVGIAAARKRFPLAVTS